MNKQVKKAVVLISGGLDSATVLAMAKIDGYACYTLSFDYGQRHRSELEAAKHISHVNGAQSHQTIKFDMAAIGGSALTDSNIDIPESPTSGIPVTYVPARNTVFLSFALGYAEVLNAQAIFVGINAVDYSGYPDCRPDYLAAYQRMADQATKAGVEGHGPQIIAPLLHWSKSQIIQQGLALNVDYALTVSCYQANSQGEACGKCDSCRLRKEGFVAAGLKDPTRYVEH